MPKLKYLIGVKNSKGCHDYTYFKVDKPFSLRPDVK